MNNATQIIDTILRTVNAQLSTANLAAYIKAEVAEERVGYESPLAQLKMGLPRASSDVIRALVRQALHAHFVGEDKSKWIALKEVFPQVQLNLERIDMALAQVLKRAGGHAWSTMAVKPLSLMVRSPIQGTAPSWVPLSLTDWLEVAEAGEIEFEPLVAAAEWELLRHSRVFDFSFLDTTAELDANRQGEWVKIPHHITRIKDSFERSLGQDWNREISELYLAGDWSAFKPHQWFKLYRLLYSATAWVASSFGGNIENAVDRIGATDVHSDAAGHRTETGGDYIGSESEGVNEAVRQSLMNELLDLEDAVDAAEKAVLYNVGHLPQCYGYDEMPAKIERDEDGTFAGRGMDAEVHAQKEQRRADMESGIVRGSAKRNRAALNDAIELLKLLA